MAIPTFYKAVDSHTDGSKGAQIDSLQENAVLPEITSQMRIQGATQLGKFYIQMDSDTSAFIGLENKGMFDARLMLSNSDSEIDDDIESDRKRFRSVIILSNTTNQVVINESDNSDFAIDDYISIGGYIVKITAINTNNGRTTFDFTPSIPNTDFSGTYVSNLIKKDFIGGNAEPFWVENVIQPGHPADEAKNVIPLIIQS